MEKENALKILRELHDKALFYERTALETFVPELKKSEDEEIRKQVVYAINKLNLPEREKNKLLAWLEKQGEQKKPADKIETKFKVGDWVVFNGLTLYVKEVVKGFYRTISKGGITNSYDWDIDNVARLWTIQDAKDGDVLAVDPWSDFPSSFVAIYKKQNGEDFDSYCFVGFDGKFYKSENGHSTEEIHPATKEQRNLLFQKMKEASYEWDEEKKELKKIEAKEVVYDKTAWSEEDDFIVENIRNSFGLHCGQMTDALKEQYDKFFNKVKSLKPQNHWKPSDEQIKVLESLIENRSIQRRHLVSLYEQLKKLK